MAISEPWVRTNGQLQSLHNFQQKFGSNCSFCLKMPKTQFWGPLTNWKFEPSPKAHTHSDPFINKHTEQVKKIRILLSWHAFIKLQAKTCYHTEKQGFGYPWLSKKIPDTPTKTHWSWAQFSVRSAYPLQNYVCFSPGLVESFGHKSTPSDSPWIEAYCPKF